MKRNEHGYEVITRDGTKHLFCFEDDLGDESIAYEEALALEQSEGIVEG